MKKSKMSLLFFSLLSLILFNCSTDVVDNSQYYYQRQTTIIINLPPNILELTAVPDTINIDQMQALSCIASDPDGDTLTYYWESLKLSENSIEEEYKIISFLNRGEFLQADKNTFWKPGRLGGKYLQICTIKDLVGYEVSAIRITNVTLNQTLHVETDTTVYNSKDDIHFIIKNDKYDLVTFENCVYEIVAFVEQQINNEWIDVTIPYGCAAVGGPVPLGLGDSYSFFVWAIPWDQDSGMEEGIYRLYFKYIYPDSLTSEILYSNEFQIMD